MTLVKKLRRTSPCGPPGMVIRVRPTYRQRYSCFFIACRPTWLLSSALSSSFRKFGRARFRLWFLSITCALSKKYHSLQIFLIPYPLKTNMAAFVKLDGNIYGTAPSLLDGYGASQVIFIICISDTTYVTESLDLTVA